MPFARASAVALAALTASSLLALPLSDEAPKTESQVEAQLGPIVIGLGGAADPVQIKAEHCLTRGCPLLVLRTDLGSPAPLQFAPGETGRVQRLEPNLFQGEGLTVERADNLLGE
jgi:hypothetical protein